MTKIRTAESVSPKHPDKLCDQISDLLLDELIKQDPETRSAIECVGGHGILLITGEVKTKAKLDYAEAARQLVDSDIKIINNIIEQSPEIAQGVDSGGAGDQGIMTGYACNQNEALIPQEQYLARKLNQYLYEKYPYDGKTQITVDDGRISAVVASFQNSKTADLEQHVQTWLKDKEVVNNPKIHLNPAGEWHIGGFDADAGLTGRKLVVDNYGPSIPIGGGCYSGKDASKVDRSAAYMARRIAVDYLRKYDAKEVFCSLGYAIGVAEPVMAVVKVDGKENQVEGYDLTPAGIRKALGLDKPIFLQTASYGHYGNNFAWED